MIYNGECYVGEPERYGMDEVIRRNRSASYEDVDGNVDGVGDMSCEGHRVDLLSGCQKKNKQTRIDIDLLHIMFTHEDK